MRVRFLQPCEVVGRIFAAGDVVSLDGTELDAVIERGVVVIDGRSWVWEDLSFQAVGINPPGLASDPTWDATHVGWSFSGSADNVLQVGAQMPHAWAEGTAIVPHLHIKTTGTASAKASRWKLEYRAANPVSSGVGEFASVTIGYDSPADSGAYRIVSFGELTMPGLTLSALIDFQITRLANSDAADTESQIAMFGGAIVIINGGTGNTMAYFSDAGATAAAAPYGCSYDRVYRQLSGVALNNVSATGRHADNA